MTSLNALDMSKWGGELTVDEANCMINNGIKLLIFGTGNPAQGGAGQWTRQQYNSWKQAGGQFTDVYIYMYLAGDVEAQVKTALNTCKGLDIRTFWIDAEDVDPESLSLTSAQRLQRIDTAIKAVNDHYSSFGFSGIPDVGIYTGGWWWRPNTKNSPMFQGYKLWDSYYVYDGTQLNPILEPWENRKYGGWPSVAMYQFEGTTDFCGQSVDLNYDPSLDQNQVGESEEMASAEYNRLVEAVFGNEERMEFLKNEGIVSLEERVKNRESDYEDDEIALQKLHDHLENHPGGSEFTGGIFKITPHS